MMAYMNQERKAELAKGVAAAIPQGWKYTLAVRDHSTLVLTIRQADVDLIGENLVVRARLAAEGRPEHRGVNNHHLNGEYEGNLLKVFQSVRDAMMVGNYDRSEVQADYFDVGWYVDINVGDWKSPFRHVAKNPARDTRALKATLRAVDTTTPRPKGMPEGLTHAQEITWMKNRIVELEAAR
jgi:hypothetical protein